MQTDFKLERRRHKRYLAQEGFFVNAANSFGKIYNISLGGMAFNYINWNTGSEQEGHLDIYLDGLDIINNIPFEVISENRISDQNSSKIISLKQCRIKFKSLDKTQKSKLEHYILHHNTGEA